jgi:hypothetical protein
MKDVASALDTLIQPIGSMTFLVDSNGESLASTVIHCVDESNVEFVGVFRKMVST